MKQKEGYLELMRMNPSTGFLAVIASCKEDLNACRNPEMGTWIKFDLVSVDRHQQSGLVISYSIDCISPAYHSLRPLHLD